MRFAVPFPIPRRRPLAAATLLALLTWSSGGVVEAGPGDAPVAAEPHARPSEFSGPVPLNLPACRTQEYLVGRNVQVGPSKALAAVVRGPYAPLAGATTDLPFATTIGFAPARCVTEARLVIRARPLGDAGNDQLTLGDISSGTRWSAYFGTGSGNNVPAFPTLTPAGTVWNGQASQTFQLDLLALPQGQSAQLASLASVLQSGQLDVLVQDDTSVESVELIVKVCPCLARICVTKFEDENGDGKQGRGELPVPGVKVEVVGAQGIPMVSTTDERGVACFDVPAPGTYVVKEVVPAGWFQTWPVRGVHRGSVVPGMLYHLAFANRRCPTRQLLAGVADDFQGGAADEPAPAPGKALSLAGNHPSAPFDAVRSETPFGHTFVLPAGGCITAATLEIRLKPLDGDTANDGFVVGCASLASFPRWTGWIGKGTNVGSAAALQAGAWNSGSPATTFTLQLGATTVNGPTASSQTLLALLDAQRTLDVLVQDDTAVDFVRLTYTLCPCERGGVKEPSPTESR